MTVMAQKKNNMKKGPFKLRSGNKPSIAKLAGVSPTKAMEVLIDGESLSPEGGKKDRAEAARQEAINEALIKRDKESMEVGGKKLKRKTVGYTGDDALAKAKEEGADADTIQAIKQGILGTKDKPYRKGDRFRYN